MTRMSQAHAGRIVEIEDGRIVKDQEDRKHVASALPSTKLDDTRPPAPGAGMTAVWPRFIEAARMAAFALLAHRLRTSLTLLGVVIGIVSVVMMVALGESRPACHDGGAQERASKLSRAFSQGNTGRSGRCENSEPDCC